MSTPYVDAALRGELDTIAQAGPGTINETLFAAACRLYTFVNAGALDEHETTQLLADAAAARGHAAQSIKDTLKSARRTTEGEAASIPAGHAARPGASAGGYADLAAYARARGVSAQAYRDAGWEEVQHRGRRALRFPTMAGPRWRYLDGDAPKYWHQGGSHTDDTKVWYCLPEALAIARERPQPLVLCNGESSVVAAQAHGVAAICPTGGGERTLPARLLDELMGVWPGALLVALDCDDKGRKAAPQLAAQLRAAGRDVRAIDLHLGAKQDLADFCALRNGTSVADLAACADLAPSPVSSTTAGGRPAWLLDENAVDQLPDPVWLVRDVLVAGEVTVVYGPSDAGKTFVVMDMTLRVAQHYPVLYVAAEDARGIKRRKQAWQQHHRLTNTGRFFLRDSVLDLLDANQVDDFIAGARAVGSQLIVIDTLSQCVPGADENSARDMSVAMASAQRIAHTLDTAVVLIHHTTKEGGNYRGSGTIKGNTYGMLEVDKDDDVIELRTERIKNSQVGKPRFFRLVPVTLGSDAQGEPITSCVLAPAGKVLRGDKLTTSELKILEALAQMTDAVGGARSGELLSETLLPKGKSFYKPLAALRGLGLAEKGLKHTDPLVITPEGRARLARESADPTYNTAGAPLVTAVAFEVNTTLGARVAVGANASSNTGSNESSNGGSNTGSNGGSNAGSNRESAGGSKTGSNAVPLATFHDVATPQMNLYSAPQSDATPCYPVATPSESSTALLPTLPPALAGEKGSNGDTSYASCDHTSVSQPAHDHQAHNPLCASPAVQALTRLEPPSAHDLAVAEEVAALLAHEQWDAAHERARALAPHHVFSIAIQRKVRLAVEASRAEDAPSKPCEDERGPQCP